MRFIKILGFCFLLASTAACAATNNQSAEGENKVFTQQDTGARGSDHRNFNGNVSGALNEDSTRVGDRNFERSPNNRVQEDSRDQGLIRVADEAANRVADLEEISRAYVIVSYQNAYVAAVQEGNTKGEVTKGLEREIAQAVKKTDAYIKNVYVSTNPDFVGRMQDYSNRIEEGDPVEGFADEFTEMVRRVFPARR